MFLVPGNFSVINPVVVSFSLLLKNSENCFSIHTLVLWGKFLLLFPSYVFSLHVLCSLPLVLLIIGTTPFADWPCISLIFYLLISPLSRPLIASVILAITFLISETFLVFWVILFPQLLFSFFECNISDVTESAFRIYFCLAFYLGFFLLSATHTHTHTLYLVTLCCLFLYKQDSWVSSQLPPCLTAELQLEFIQRQERAGKFERQSLD